MYPSYFHSKSIGDYKNNKITNLTLHFGSPSPPQHCSMNAMMSSQSHQPYTVHNNINNNINGNAAATVNTGASMLASTPSLSSHAVESVDFTGLTRPIGLEYVSSLGSSSYSRESTPSNGSSVHFMDGYRDFNGNSPHSSYAMFAQSEYPPPNAYAGYNPAYHYTNPYINPATSNGYPLTVAGDYNPNTFGMPPPQHLPQDIKLTKDR